jgi:hypothetical protein
MSVGLPGVDCPACGQIWGATHRRIPIELPDDHFLRQSKGSPVYPTVLHGMMDLVREDLGLPDDTPLYPGTLFGSLHITCTSNRVPAFQWFVANVLISDEGIARLTENGITGWTTRRVEISVRRRNVRPPNVHQFIVTGNGGNPITSPPITVRSICALCGRIEYNEKRIDQFALDTRQWSGDDFFKFAPPFDGYTFCTEAVRNVLEPPGAYNVGFYSVGEFLEKWARYV